LQDNVIPLYYGRDKKHGHSPGWVKLCQQSMATVLPHFNSYRVLHDYACRFYGPAAQRGRVLATDNYTPATELAKWKVKVRTAWPSVVLKLVSDTVERIDHDDRLRLSVDVLSSGLVAQDIRVECVMRRVMCSELTVPVPQFARDAQVGDGIRYVGDDVVSVIPLEPADEVTQGGARRYELDCETPWCGELTYEIRAVPQHPHLSHPYDMGLMHWL